MPALNLPINELNAFDLPPVCLITGERNNVAFHKVKFAWYPRWIWLLIFLPVVGIFLTMIVGFILTNRAVGELPFSQEGWSRWRTAKIMVGVQVLCLLVALFIGVRLGPITTLAVLAAAVAIYFTFQRNHRVTPMRITKTEIILKLPSGEAALAIRDHLYAGQPMGAPALPGARCARHPEAPATWACKRCGGFMCAACEHRVRSDARPLCTNCWMLRSQRMAEARARIG